MKTDLQIQKDVMDELKWNPILISSEIGVAVKDAIVTLSGIVNSYTKKLDAEKSAENVCGVKAVAVDLQVGISPANKKTDAEIAAAVINALKFHTSIPDDKINVTVEDGIVTLDGEVEWQYEKVAAKNAIQNFAGITQVWNFIKIKPKVDTVDVKEKIKSAFQRNASLDANKILVTTYNGDVILSGFVSSLNEKEEASSAAWAAPGVSKVHNNLLVEEEEYAI